jgi:single-strand DNA-binding protein
MRLKNFSPFPLAALSQLELTGTNQGDPDDAHRTKRSPPMNEIPFYTAANLTRDPELRNTQDGKSVARLSLAVTPRRREQGTWVDGTTTFLDATVWGDQAENVALSLHKGDRVIVTGRVETRVYTPTQGANAGQEVRKLEVVVDEVGPSLRWAEAQIQRTSGHRAEDTVSEEDPV